MIPDKESWCDSVIPTVILEAIDVIRNQLRTPRRNLNLTASLKVLHNEYRQRRGQRKELRQLVESLVKNILIKSLTRVGEAV